MVEHTLREMPRSVLIEVFDSFMVSSFHRMTKTRRERRSGGARGRAHIERDATIGSRDRGKLEKTPSRSAKRKHCLIFRLLPLCFLSSAPLAPILHYDYLARRSNRDHLGLAEEGGLTQTKQGWL